MKPQLTDEQKRDKSLKEAAVFATLTIFFGTLSTIGVALFIAFFQIHSTQFILGNALVAGLVLMSVGCAALIVIGAVMLHRRVHLGLGEHGRIFRQMAIVAACAGCLLTSVVMGAIVIRRLNGMSSKKGKPGQTAAQAG